MVFTDIVGYSAIVHRDEALGAKLLDRQRAVVRALVPAYGGREVETAGDSFLLEFNSALAAVHAVIAIQQSLARENASQPPDEAVHLRASVHLGDVEHRGREVYGDGVNTAARLMPLSPEGGMAISAPVLAMVRQRLEIPVRSIGTPSLKNISTPVEILVLEAADLQKIEVPPPAALQAAEAPVPATPQSSAVPAAPVPARARAFPRRVAFAALGAAALAAAALAFWRLGTPAAPAAASDLTAQAAPPAKSIAVLPFSDLSPAHDQEYFADGMAEELLNALAKIKDLKVAGRTSSFSFKGKNEDLRTVGKALSVAHVLEGSVRKQGDKVRITAQLIRADNGYHLWSETYDGNLTDVFQLQERIARAITDQLKVVLEGDQKTRLVQVGTRNTQAYNLYLQATDALNHRDYPRMGDAIGWLDAATKLDPDFAPARARLAMIHVLGWARYGASLSEAQRQAQLAFALDPKLAETQYALGLLARRKRHYLEAHVAMDRALELAPDDASANFYAAQLLINTGYTRQGIARLDRALSIDPLLPNALHWRALQHLFAGDPDTAERLWKRAAEAGLSYANLGLARVADARGDYAKARSLSLSNLLANNNDIACLNAPDVSLPVYFEGAYGGDAAARAKALAVVDECLAARPETVPLWAVRGLQRFHQPGRVLHIVAQGPISDDAGFFIDFWSPKARDARRLADFTAFARKVGFATLWDRYGAPDLCRRRAPGDYVCE